MDGWKEREREGGKHCAEAFVAAVNPYRRRTGAVLTAGLSFRATQRDLVYGVVPLPVMYLGRSSHDDHRSISVSWDCMDVVIANAVQ